MKVALHGKNFSPDTLPFVTRLLQHLSQKQAQLFVSPPLQALLQNTPGSLPALQPLPQDLTSMDCMVSLGGDGTLLEAVKYVGAAEVPVLGINTGRMGFLATVIPEEALDALARLEQGDYNPDPRTLLQVTTRGTTALVPNFALNEVAVLKQDSAAMITVHVCINGHLRTTYWADGLMVATPTGSTGYSLSVGGPIMLPSAHSLVITPVSPHNLSVRPLVVPDSAVISLRVASRNQKFLATLDGRASPISTDIELVVSQAPFRAQLVNLGTHNLFDVLRQKLHWGLDVRN